MVRGLDNVRRFRRVLDTEMKQIDSGDGAQPFPDNSVTECRRKLVKQNNFEGAHFIILVRVNFLYQHEIQP
jgi:hypothetical protein